MRLQKVNKEAYNAIYWQTGVITQCWINKHYIHLLGNSKTTYFFLRCRSFNLE